MQGDLFIGSFLVPDNTLVYSEGWIDFEVTQRTIDNTLVSDFIGFKRKFSMSWENWLSGGFVDYVVGIYEAKQDVVFKKILADNSEELYTCKLSISDNYVREYKELDFAFSGFSITLEEV